MQTNAKLSDSDTFLSAIVWYGVQLCFPSKWAISDNWMFLPYWVDYLNGFISRIQIYSRLDKYKHI